jgi:hypothetical protein
MGGCAARLLGGGEHHLYTYLEVIDTAVLKLSEWHFLHHLKHLLHLHPHTSQFVSQVVPLVASADRR